ncbi:MAG: MBL fold metallo-hydrolase [Bacteroidales bacterium]|nr:MBL fold metallo-hydrolase [Bacteroidales bacterium]
MTLIDRIEWLGQATVKITTGNLKIYVDPYMITNKDAADFIFITHSHNDHLSMDDIRKVSDSQTRIFAAYDCIPKLSDAGFMRIRGVAPGDREDLEHFKFEAVPAYNVKKTNYHPKSNRWLGYIFEVEGKRIYHAGDTERIPEMKSFRCDIAMLPLGQTYTMNSVEEAVEAAKDVRAKTAIPIHYGLYEGKKEDALKFRELLQNEVEVIIK